MVKSSISNSYWFHNGESKRDFHSRRRGVEQEQILGDCREAEGKKLPTYKPGLQRQEEVHCISNLVDVLYREEGK